MDGINGNHSKASDVPWFTKSRLIFALVLFVFIAYFVGTAFQVNRPKPTSLTSMSIIGGAVKSKLKYANSKIGNALSEIKSALTSHIDEKSTLEVNQEWSPYMDILDEDTALLDPPLTDIKRGVDVRFSKVYLQESRVSYVVGDTVSVRIDLYDGYGNRRQRGGDQLRVRIFEETLNASASGYVLDHTNGSYTARIKCLWPGSPTILVYISYTREAVRALYHIRKTLSSTRDTYALYGKTGERKRCHALKTRFNKATALCDFASNNGNMSWFCEAPTSKGTCGDLKSFEMKYPFPELPITKAEEQLFKRNGEHLQPVVNITVKEKSTIINNISNKPACATFNRTKLWFLASPIGHFMHNKWVPEHCKATPSDKFRQCLQNKHVFFYGDSTIRQWFDNMIHRFDCKLTSEKWTQDKWKKDSAAFCPSLNLIVEWVVHELPGNLGPQNETKYRKNSIVRTMLEFAENKDAIFVIHMLCHLSTYHHSVFRDRMSRVRKSIDTILKVNKDAKILIKGGHTFRDIRQVSDYYGYVYRTIYMEEFKGVYDKVVYLDNKDMTIARETLPNHPDEIVVREMVNQMLWYVCE